MPPNSNDRNILYKPYPYPLIPCLFLPLTPIHQVQARIAIEARVGETACAQECLDRVVCPLGGVCCEEALGHCKRRHRQNHPREGEEGVL